MVFAPRLIRWPLRRAEPRHAKVRRGGPKNKNCDGPLRVSTDGGTPCGSMRLLERGYTKTHYLSAGCQPPRLHQFVMSFSFPAMSYAAPMETLRARFSNPLFLIAFRQWRVFPDCSRGVLVALPRSHGTR